MAIGYVSAGTAVYDNATSPLAVGFPATVAAGLKAVMLIGQKPSTANSGSVTPPSGWGAITGASLVGAGGYGATLGADTGNTNIHALELTALTTGSEGGTTVSLVHATTNVLWAQIILLSSATGTFDTITATTGSDTSAGSVSIAGAGSLAWAPGDLALWGMCIPTDVTTPAQFSAHAITAASITFAAATEIAEYDSTTGNDIGGFSAYAGVSSGTATSTPTFTATAGGTTTNVRGPGVILRIREGAPVAPTIVAHPAAATDILDAASRTFSVSATGTPTLTYQWEQNDGAGWSNVSGGSGGTTATYTAPTSTAAMNGRQYRCVVTNGEGSATSDAATWTVVPYRALAGIQDTTNGTTFNGSSITVGQDRLGVVHVVGMGFDTSDRASPTNVRIGSHELTKFGSDTVVGPYTLHTKWRCLSTSGAISGTLQVVFNGADQQDNISVGAGEWEGVDTGGTNGSTAAGTVAENSGTSASMSVSSITDPGSSGSWVMAMWGWGDPASAANQTHSPSGGLVEASEGAAVDSGWYSASAISVGVKAASVAGTLTASETYAGAAFVPIMASGGTVESRTLSSGGVGAASFTSFELHARTTTIAGAASVSLQSAATAQVTLTAAGSAATSLQSSAIEPRTMSAAGTGATSLVGGAVAAATLSSAGAASVSFAGGQILSATVSAAGAGAASWTSQAIWSRTVSAAGAAATAFQSAAIEPRTASAAGAASASFAAAAVVPATITISGLAAATFDGSDGNTGTTESRTVAIAGTGAASFEASALHVRTASAAGAASVAFTGGAVLQAAVTAAGTGAAAFQSAGIAVGNLAAAGSAAVALQSTAIAEVGLSAGGAAAVAFEAGQLELRTLGAAGAAAVTFIGTDAAGPVIEARTFALAGAAAVSFDGTNIGTPVEPPAPPEPSIPNRTGAYVPHSVRHGAQPPELSAAELADLLDGDDAFVAMICSMLASGELLDEEEPA